MLHGKSAGEQLENYPKLAALHSKARIADASRRAYSKSFGMVLSFGLAQKERVVPGRGGSLAAYAIFDRPDHPAWQLKRVRFADFRMLCEYEGLLRPALRWMLQKCHKENIRVAENAGCYRVGLVS